MNELYFLKKSIRIEDILTHFGYQIQESDKNEFFIHSPFRDEKTPSFKVNKKLNTWYDFGEAVGGSNVELLIKLKKFDTKQAVNFLRNFGNTNDTAFSSFPPQNISYLSETRGIEQKKDNASINIFKEQTIQNKALIDYLKSRKIDLDLARLFLKEIYFKNGEKTYFALAWKNQKGGFNWRNKYMKGCINNNSYTFISGTDEQTTKKVAIFEGMFDYLSAVIYFKIQKNESDVIVLNSLSNLKNIDLSKYQKINLFLDNDDAGIRAKNDLIEELGKEKIIKDYSSIYKGYKDFNEFLINML